MILAPDLENVKLNSPSLPNSWISFFRLLVLKIKERFCCYISTLTDLIPSPFRLSNHPVGYLGHRPPRSLP